MENQDGYTDRRYVTWAETACLVQQSINSRRDSVLGSAKQVHQFTVNDLTTDAGLTHTPAIISPPPMEVNPTRVSYDEGSGWSRNYGPDVNRDQNPNSTSDGFSVGSQMRQTEREHAAVRIPVKLRRRNIPTCGTCGELANVGDIGSCDQNGEWHSVNCLQTASIFAAAFGPLDNMGLTS